MSKPLKIKVLSYELYRTAALFHTVTAEYYDKIYSNGTQVANVVKKYPIRSILNEAKNIGIL